MGAGATIIYLTGVEAGNTSELEDVQLQAYKQQIKMQNNQMILSAFENAVIEASNL